MRSTGGKIRQIDLFRSWKRNKDITLVVKDRTGEIGCLRFNHPFPPFDNAAIRRVVVGAMDQKEIIEAVAGAEPSLIKTDVGIFVPGTPMASTVGVGGVTRGPKDYEKLKRDPSSPPATRARRSSSSRPPRFRPSGPRRSLPPTR